MLGDKPVDHKFEGKDDSRGEENIEIDLSLYSHHEGRAFIINDPIVQNVNARIGPSTEKDTIGWKETSSLAREVQIMAETDIIMGELRPNSIPITTNQGGVIPHATPSRISRDDSRENVIESSPRRLQTLATSLGRQINLDHLTAPNSLVNALPQRVAATSYLHSSETENEDSDIMVLST